MNNRSKSLFNILALFALLSSLLGSALTFTPAYAAGAILVNSSLDTVADDDTCTLREAIISANTDTASGIMSDECVAGSGADTITFAADYTITLGSQLPAVTSEIIINGKGAANTILQASTCNPVTLPGGCTPATYRVFEVDPTGDLTLDGLTVRHGNCAGACSTFDQAGGGILNRGSMTISNTVIHANSSSNTGGGITTFQASATFTNVTVSGNSSTYGGGMSSQSSSEIFTNVTFSGNTATGYGFGGGMFNGSITSQTLTNVTFDANTSYAGGGLYNQYSSPTLTNVTFSANSATFSGGGMYNQATSSPTLINTLIANSTAGGDCVIEAAPLNASSSNNLIEDAAKACGLTDGVNGNIIGSDPVLGALANNGGSTQTFALLPGSPAIDAGLDANCPATDQRGNDRPTGSQCDIGAYEMDNSAPSDISLSSNAVAENRPVGTTVGTLTATDPDASDTHTYSLACAVPGVNDASFAILGNVLKTAAIFDYETRNSYDLCIRADDGDGGTYDENFSVTVTDGIDILTATLRSINDEDGWVLESGENTNKGGSMNSSLTTLRLGDNAAKRQYRSLLSFATSSLPDNAVITRVTLKVKRQGVVGGGNPVIAFQGFILDIRKGTFGMATLQLADWKSLAHKTIGPAKPPLVGGWYTFNLTGAKATINKLVPGNGVTQIRLRFKLGDNNNRLANYLSLYSGNAPFASRPKLIIKYYIP